MTNNMDNDISMMYSDNNENNKDNNVLFKRKISA